jgi:cardiolipin synthase
MLDPMRRRDEVIADGHATLVQLRALAESAFSRAAGAPLIGGNHVELLEDAGQNYPRWLAAIADAQDHVHFENYIIRDDAVGQQFADALAAKARAGVRVRLIYDYLGSFGGASRAFWSNLRAAGVEVRSYNPPRLGSPLGWLSRDHRKTLTVDNTVGFVSGLCVAAVWLGDPARGREPWRDTGVEIRGPAVAEIERAFARVWALTGEPMPEPTGVPAPAGDVSIRIVSTEPATVGMLRLDQMVAALAQHRLWLTDPYFSGTALYVQALRAAVEDGVDVRMLVPSATDLPLLKPFSQAGYRTLLEVGVRIFEWNGTMVHAKTAVADGHWARVGSTNLNLASWLGNCELDAVIEDNTFAAQMEEMFLRDLANTTEIVLNERRRIRAPGRPHRDHPRSGGRGSPGRVAAGAMRMGQAIGAALTNRRVLGPVEGRLAIVTGLLLCLLAGVVWLFPKALAYPAAALALWGGLVLAIRGIRLCRGPRACLRPPAATMQTPGVDDGTSGASG